MTATLQSQFQTAPKASASLTSRSVLQRKCSCGGTPGPSGECAECRKKRLLQTKLTVNEPGDKYEQEADRIADRVMRMPASIASTSAPINVQRLDGGGNSGAATAGAQAPSIVRDVLNSSGRPLDGDAREFMESRFGHDFGSVRVHTDRRAAKSARAVNAQAYTVGQDVVFGAGQYAPGVGEGKKLLAHELAHVVQQGQGKPALQRAPLTEEEKQEDLQSPRFAGQLRLEKVFDNDPPMRFGERGAAVALVQQALIDLGFAMPASTRNGTAPPDGIYGGETLRTVQAFQTEHQSDGLLDEQGRPDGIVGRKTMGKLDKLFAESEPTPPAGPAPGPGAPCVDGSVVSTDRDPLPPVPPFAFEMRPADEVMKRVREIQPAGEPIPDKVPLGITQPTFKTEPVVVKALPIPDASCMKCVAEWKVTPSIETLIATGHFTDEPKRFAAFQPGSESGCPSRALPQLLEVRKLILPEMHPVTIAAEREHYNDFVRAFQMVGGRYLSNVNRLTPERTPLRGKDQAECKDKVEVFLSVVRGLPAFHPSLLTLIKTSLLEQYPTEFGEDFKALFSDVASAARDRGPTAPHKAVPIPPPDKPPIFPNIDLARNPFGCEAFARKFTTQSARGIPGASSEDLMKDTTEPPKQGWHVL